MTPLLSVLLALSWGSTALLTAAPPPEPEEPRIERAEAAPPKSVVYAVTSPSVVTRFESDVATERRMTDRLITGLARENDLRTAWVKLVAPTPADVIGIKVATAGGRLFSSHRGVVDSVVRGLELAGVPRTRVIIWDRSSEDLAAAGFVPRKGGPQVWALDPPRGFDAEAKVTAPVLGQLIWGDFGFRGMESGLRRMALEQDMTSAHSHIARVLTKQVTKVINIPTFSDERGCAVAGAMYNATVPNLDNTRRFLQSAGRSSICDLYADPRLGGKVVLTIVDGLVAQYAGGPEFNPNYALAYRTLLASKDPVALDATIFRKLEEWRVQAKLPSQSQSGSWLQEAETIGLGNYDPARIEIQAVRIP